MFLIWSSTCIRVLSFGKDVNGKNNFYHITNLVSNVIQPLRIFLSLTRVRQDFIGQSTVPMYSYAQTQKHADPHSQMSMFWTLIFQFISLDSVM